MLETVLVVDDNAGVLEIVSSILRAADFNVLTATSGPAAVKLAHDRPGVIDLLLSDWDMPEMSGPALGEVLKILRPDIHVMLMSGGGPAGALLVLNYGWAYIEKPFDTEKLVEMVTDVLRSPNRSQLGGMEYDSRKDPTRKA